MENNGIITGKITAILKEDQFGNPKKTQKGIPFVTLKIAGQTINCFEANIIANPDFQVGAMVEATVKGQGKFLNLVGLKILSNSPLMSPQPNIQVEHETISDTPVRPANTYLMDKDYKITKSWAVNVAATLLAQTGVNVSHPDTIRQLFDLAESIMSETVSRDWFNQG